MDFGIILQSAAQAAESNNRMKINDGDYKVDGLYYCGKCHTQKQVRFEIAGQMFEPLCLCECAAKAMRDEDERRRRRDRQLEIEHMRSRVFPSSEMAQWRFSVDDGQNEKISRVAKRYADNFSEIRKMRDLNGLLFYGSVGTGKTFFAACIANELLEHGHTVYFTNFARLANEMTGRKEDRQQFLDDLNDYDLLVLDDLSAERDTEYMGEVVFQVIDARAVSRKPMIITTNLTAEQLKYSETDKKARVYSRILERCAPVEVAGADRRKKKLTQNYKGMADLLGI